MKLIFRTINNILKNDLKITIILFVIIVLYLLHIFQIDGKSFLYNDGWYYTSIARSIIAGKGFVNPFDVETGPTAWVPPFLVYVFVPIYKIIGDNFAARFFIMFIQMIGLSVGFYFLLKAWALTTFKKNNLLIFLIFFFLLYSYSIQIFRMINDLWLYIFISCLLIYGLTNYIKFGKSIKVLVILAILIPLAAPIFVPGFITIMALLFISDLGQKFNLRFLKIFPEIVKPRFLHIILIGIVFVLSVSIWTIRNYIVFDKLIPSKSNQWFEFYLSNVKDEDGILSESTVEMYHPDRNREKFKNEIKTKNEVGWLKQYDSISHVYLKEHKLDYYKKVLNRCKNSLIFTEDDNNLWYTKIGSTMPDSDRIKLYDNVLIKDSVWVCLSSQPTEVWRKFSTLFPNRKYDLYNDWKRNRISFFHEKYSKRFIFTGLLMALFPFLSILFLLVFVRNKEKSFIFIISILYFVYLMPYILISHELRYQQPLYAWQSLLISVTVMYLITIFHEKYMKWKLNFK